MAWSYTGDPAAVARDAVRFLVGQTSTGDDVLLADEELAYCIAQTNSNYAAAALAAETLAARYRQTMPDGETIGELSVTWGDRAARLDALALTLRRRVALKHATPFLGGQSAADRTSRQDATDLRQPAFRTEQFDDQSPEAST